MTKPIQLGLLLVLGLLINIVSTSQANASILGASFGGSIYSVNDSTGAATLLGSSGFGRLNGMAGSSNGVIYSVSEASLGGVSTLITINSSTGAGTAVATLTLGGNNFLANGVRGLAIRATSDLFAIIDLGAPGSLGPDSLYRVNATTGALTLVGASGRSGMQGLAFSANGTLYGWDVGGGLYTLNTTSGQATRVGGSGGLQALEFRSDGTLFGTNETLYTVNPSNGSTTFVGTHNIDLRGLAYFDSGTVPEPATLAIWSLLGLAGAFYHRKRKSKMV